MKGMLVGVISDTHGALPASVEDAFSPVEQIIHAGDIGSDLVIVRLEALAPVVAVHGNMDSGDLEWRYPERALVRLGAHRALVGHIAQRLVAGGIPADVDIVITGHTHEPRIARKDGVLYINPGSGCACGRSDQVPTAALLNLNGAVPSAEIVKLL